MFKNLHINFRKDRMGPESELVEHFLSYCDNLFKKENLEYTVITELYAEVGIPDILIVAWDKDVNWNIKRNNLDKTDIRVLHHLSSKGRKGLKFQTIIKHLGYSESRTYKSLDRLLSANLVQIENGVYRICDTEKAFFLKKIISVEAKMSDWRKAMHQASINQNFSSHSYILMPNEKISEKLLSSLNGNIGLLAHHSDGATLKKRAKKSKLPGSHFSWVLNEYIGRKYLTTT
ncbi:hypothetical protein AAU57_03555 [Nonlabens sp. YIK11]|uniref:hypothetical protein n=1 Tax=Nonlabens sp. YIK11 TaxID=1453349 RepID=UPI0006DC1E59|nr:hypothetical protein [Nonlabens sp. YIK11]KQC32510.1 hypothetical protein AAU57_03555 [Nonlabens sp. YIK11]